MLRRLGIRAKVLAVLAVPMLVVLFAGAFISAETLRDLQSEQNVRRIVAAATSYVAVNEALNEERAVSQSTATPDTLKAARDKTDEAVATFLPALDAVDVSSYSSAVPDGIDAVRRGFTEQLPQVRTSVDGGQLRVVGTGYATFVSDQLSLFDHLAQEVANRDVATYLSAYVSIGRTVSSLVQEQVDGASLLAQINPSPAAGQSYNTLASQTEVYRETARAAVSDLAIPGVLLPSGDPTATFTRYRGLIGTGSALAMSVVQPKSYLDEITTQREDLSRISGQVLQTSDTVSAKAITAAQQRAVLTIGVTALAVVASFLLALVVSRTIVIPLRRLTAAATDLREELPRLVEQVQVPGEGPQMSAPQIPVTSRDEVGRLAGAFNAVNATTFHVAQEQAALRGSIAEMFVNVARRDQVLLNRQLSFIDSLERTEEDPQALANLFRLDHLATRMRRNAESLLVLAGIDSGRRLRDTLPLSDVVRTASSEIEQYDRVELDLQADPHMLGFNALPAAHLLAELLENATVFSEPETPVIVTTGVAGPFVEVRILDLGLGMSDAELAAANEKIASTAASDALGAQRLGLFVVGRLAQRLSAEVVLRKNANGSTGTETVVRFPATLFQSTEASPLGVYGERAAAEAPELTEFDLATLTDGVTEQGLPRRRSADVGPVGLPLRGAPRAAYDENAIMLPDVEASSLPTDLSAAASDWSPLHVPGAQGSGLPNRQPAAAADPAGTTGDERPVAPADPAVRAGLFAGFRGRADRAPVEQEPTASSEPAGPGFVVPGLAPDDDWAPVERTAEETGQPAADQSLPSWASWASSESSWSEQSEGYVPAAFAPEATDQPAPLFASPASGPWTPAQDAAAEEPQEAAAAAVEADEADEAGSLERWTPPQVDVTQWSVPDQEVPAFEQQPDAFAGLSDWTAPRAEAIADTTPYAPFERSLDEARAWATGAIPVVPEPQSLLGTDTPDAPAEPAEQPADELAADELAETAAWEQWHSGPEQWSVDVAIPQLEPDVLAPDDRADVLAPVPSDEGPAEVEAPAAEALAEPLDQPVALAAEAFAELLEQPVAPAAEALAEPFDQPVAPAWAPTAAAGSFGDLVAAGGPEPSKRRRGWFGRRKQQVVAAPAPAAPLVPVVEPVVVAPVPALPVRSSAWAPAVDAVAPEPFPVRAPAAVPVPVPASATPATQAYATPAPVAPAAPEPVTASTSWAPQSSWNPPAAPVLPESSAGRSAPSWAPPEWAPRPAQSADPEPTLTSSVEPTAAPRIGTLDDEVAAMLALRSDIQEQALSELSQLSAYRPQVVTGADRLTRRVPTAVPEAPEIVESAAERNPDEVRSRLASFQSGTARGRRDAGQDEETS